ncbi:hypothetical protein AOLI_G00090650 [Acnodon oligacanthus]
MISHTGDRGEERGGSILHRSSPPSIARFLRSLAKGIHTQERLQTPQDEQSRPGERLGLNTIDTVHGFLPQPFNQRRYATGGEKRKTTAALRAQEEGKTGAHKKYV